ncbi:MAG TPA: asparagine synthase-related protein [Solirubrobacteraceae bacterium]|nr:asparagine synthase-related protein [Solirubrobacteraceae bacterium]
MLLGAWGVRAGELLERAAEQDATTIHRVDALAMPGPPDLTRGTWQCWLFGAPQARGGLAARFSATADEPLAVSFGRALEHMGETACELLIGRFVVVALDRDRGRCSVMRDQLGAQPLLYTRAADGIVFAEHERDLLELLPSACTPDRLSLLQWIGNGLTPRGRTLYHGMNRLPAGHRLSLHETGTHVERWWRLRYEEAEAGSPDELAERVRDASFAAIERAAAGSERPAVKLSGGLDSACVAAGLAANGFADGRALALGGSFPGYQSTDESELIKATAHHTRLPLELIPFDPHSSMLAPAIAHIERWRVPPATPNLFLWQPLTARARELGVDLMLDGEGGDELFAAAPMLIADELRGGRLRAAWSLAGRVPGVGPSPGMRMRLRELRRSGLGSLIPPAVRRCRRALTSTSSPTSIIRPADAQALARLHIPAHQHDGPLWWQALARSVTDVRDLLDLGGHFRRTSTDDGLDRGHPLLYDLPLIETVLRIPPRAQFDPVRDRPVLRDALNGLIPEAVRSRYVKSHFTPLVLAGIRASETQLIDPLRRSDAPIRAYVAQEALDRKLAVAAGARPMLGAASMWRIGIANRWLSAGADEGA